MTGAAENWLSSQLAVYREPLVGLSKEERGALRRIRIEARLRGAKLKRRRRAGLSPSLLLSVFRRDGYRCKVHGDLGHGDCGGLEVHHKGHLENPSARMATLGRANDPKNLVVVCARAHNEIHDRDRAESKK